MEEPVPKPQTFQPSGNQTTTAVSPQNPPTRPIDAFRTNGDNQPLETNNQQVTPVQPHEDEEEAVEKESEHIILSWSAPEFTLTKKPIGWYLMLYGIFAVLIVLAIIFKQWFSIVLSIIMAIAITFYANRKPHNLVYTITNYGISAGDKKYIFDQLKAFSVSNDYGQMVLNFIPVKRFEPMISLPVSSDKSEDAEDLLIQVLPKTELHEDLTDKIFKFFRF